MGNCEEKLFESIKQGNMLDFLLYATKADINFGDRPMTPLGAAIYYKQYEMAHHLLSLGVDVNKQDSQGNIALHNAVELNNLAMVKLLLRHKANLSICNRYGETPLHKALYLNPLWSMATLLVEQGADPTKQDYNGDSCINFAESWGEKENLNKFLSVCNIRG